MHPSGPTLFQPEVPAQKSHARAIADSFLDNGKLFRAAGREMDAIRQILDRAGATTDFGDLPILVFSAGEQPEEQLRAMGLDPELMRTEWHKMQLELAELSSNGRQFILSGGGHATIVTREDQAEIIVAEIRTLLQQL